MSRFIQFQNAESTPLNGISVWVYTPVVYRPPSFPERVLGKVVSPPEVLSYKFRPPLDMESQSDKTFHRRGGSGPPLGW